jgi:glycosyltransferase involved in cell wall biosynthesis
MKVLFVTPYLPSPPRFGAQRRLDGLMRGLAARHEVSLLSFEPDGSDPGNTLELTSSYCHKVVLATNHMADLGVGKKRMMQLRSLLLSRSFEHQLRHSRAFQQAIDRELAGTAYDVVQVEFSHLGIYEFCQRAARKPVRVLDEHNIEYEIVRRTAESENSLVRKLYSAVNWRKVRSEELDAWRRFDGVVLTSDRDEQMLLEDAPGKPTSVVPNAVDLEQFRTRSVPREPGTLIFFGAMNYHPNIQGVEYFVSEVLPQIVAEVPGVKLRVVGQQPPDSIRALAGQNVEIVGFVDDPRALLDRSAAMVVPLLIGGGTRFKIVEGLAMSMPIVSTHLGAEGLEVEHDRHLLLATDAESLARQTIRVLKDASLGERLGKAARELAERRYGWGHAVEQLEGFYEGLLR